MEAFPAILSRLRRERHLNQRTAAAALHISQALLSHYENGLREPGLGFVDAACRYYGVSADYLLGRSPLRQAVSEDGELPPALLRLAETQTAALSALLAALRACGDAETDEAAAALLSLTAYRLLGPFAEQAADEPFCGAALALAWARLRGLAAEKNLRVSLPPALEAAAADIDALREEWRETR